MKKTLITIAAVAALLIPVSLFSNPDRIITADQLPAAAKAFIQQYFPEVPVSYAKKDVELMKTTYEVRLNDGTEIDFNGNGEWDKVSCRSRAIPAELVPAAIVNYVDGSFPGQAIVKIDKEYYGYEIELINELELKFDKQGNLLNIDD